MFRTGSWICPKMQEIQSKVNPSLPLQDLFYKGGLRGTPRRRDITEKMLMGFSPRPVGLHLSVKVGGLTHYMVCELPTLVSLLFFLSLSLTFFFGGVIRHSCFIFVPRSARKRVHLFIDLPFVSTGVVLDKHVLFSTLFQ